MAQQKSTNTPILIGLGLFALVALGLWWFSQTGLGAAPKVKITTLDGQKIQVSDPQKFTLVNFWATSCPSCVAEMPKLKAFFQKNKAHLRVIAVAMSYDDPKAVRTFIRQKNLPFLVVHDKDNTISQAFGTIRVTPTNYLISPQGHIIYQKIGEPRFDAWQKALP